VIGQAKLEELTEGAKPEMEGPFGVQDNGEITNATGVPIGKLVDGEPQDLVGTSIKEIDAEGNLKKASGSIIGKAEIKPDVLDDKVDEGIDLSRQSGDEAEGAGDKLDEASPPEADSKIDEAGEKVDEAGEKIDEAAPGEELAESRIDEAGEKVDEAAPGEEPAESKIEEAGEKIDEAAPGEEPAVRLPYFQVDKRTPV
jgi:hypothetical protein